jgi:hypothetical protein
MQRMTSMERAFHLARSGRFTTLTEMVTTLDREGYSANQIQGPLLKRQLTGLIKAARPELLDRDLSRGVPGNRATAGPDRKLGATTGRETIEPHRHVAAHSRPPTAARKRICEAIGGWLAQGPRGRRSQGLWPTQWNVAPPPLLGHAARICPCAAARWRPRVRPPRRGAFTAQARPEQEPCPQPCRGSRKGAAATRSSGFAACRGHREAELAA